MYTIRKSPREAKKYRVTTPEGLHIDFGATGYQDFTIHKDEARKARYMARHKKREDWTKAGINTAGFWSYNLLWNKDTIEKSAKDIEDRFDVSISIKK